MQPPKIDHCTPDDFHYIMANQDAFWGSERLASFHHPMFLHEFGDNAFVIRNGKDIIAYLMGFIHSEKELAYCHLVAVHNDFKRQGLGHSLYRHFIENAKAKGCVRLKAITTPSNHRSIDFHRSLGMHLTGDPNDQGIPVVKDYSGPGHDRVVFEMDIT